MCVGKKNRINKTKQNKTPDFTSKVVYSGELTLETNVIDHGPGTRMQIISNGMF